MKKKRKWWEVVLIGFVGFCVVPTLLMFGVCAVGEKDLEQTHNEWDQKLALLVEHKASVEEVRQIFLDAGEEPVEFEADDRLEREHELVVFSERQPLWPLFLSSLVLQVEFDEYGQATGYEVHEAYVAL